jgi:hypothetical protein
MAKSDLLSKIASSIELSFDIPDSEKKIAQDAIEYLQGVFSALKVSSEHLDIIYEPFKKYPSVSKESVIENRGVIDRYKEKIKENYNKMKQYALFAIRSLNEFSSDNKILEIIESFKSSIDEIEKSVTTLLEMLGDFESDTYRDNIIKQIEEIKTETDETRDLIKDRVIEHLEVNILAESWLEKAEKEFDQSGKTPEEIKQTLMVVPVKKEQALNPGDAQRI